MTGRIPPLSIPPAKCPDGLVAQVWIRGELARERELPGTLAGELGVLELMAELDAGLVDGLDAGEWVLAVYDGDTGAPAAFVGDWYGR